MRLFLRQMCYAAAFLGLSAPLAPFTRSQTTEAQKMPVISGTVCDAENQPLSGVELTLLDPQRTTPIKSFTDAQGQFRITLPPGTYTLRAQSAGYEVGSAGAFEIRAGEQKTFTLRLVKPNPSGLRDAATVPFSDDPQFIVAGVTDTSALGVHASSRNMPNSNALAKDTVALGRETANTFDENAIRAKLAAAEDPNLRFELAEIEEREGHALEAAKDYQRAAELAPTEEHFFGWGAELLLHRAFEPAIDVFSKGHQRYPQSLRMLLGLGATRYAQGSREEAARLFLQASDLEPPNPQPYLFLGRLLATETTTPAGWTERMHRFAILHHENATAHFLYGLALAKSGTASAEAASELQQATELDPHCGDAYLQLGILFAQGNDFPKAVAALQKAIENTPWPDEAHYRLAEIYRRMGEAEKARQESALYKQISQQKSQEAERERHEIQQFIYTLRDSKGAPPPDAVSKPN